MVSFLMEYLNAHMSIYSNIYKYYKYCKFEPNFDGGKLSSDAGLLLFHEFCVQIGVPELFKELFPENREGVFIHEKPDILYQELIRIIGGYPSNNAAKDLQHDPILREIHGNNSLTAKD